ncbi:polyphosphate:AMP phosphotransferase [Verrucomicrobiales bacterium]|jgi:AMP-polyphosphate phosphotransferase|nr:polyphosphate:AMP phosphotransferase [Verrucomicrobiales bacterium]
MFDTAELDRKVSKEDYAEKAPLLRQELLETQIILKEAPFPVIVLFGGVDGAGKSETINLLHEWLDPRWLIARAYGKPTEEAAQRPSFWRFWRDLPPHGRIGFFLSAWYSDPILNRVHNKTSDAEFDEELDQILNFEKGLTDDRVLIVKFWMHLGRDAQKERFQQLEEDPLTSWRVKEKDWENWEKYDDFTEATERAITKTSRGQAPWHIVEGADERYRTLSVAGTLLERIKRHTQQLAASSEEASPEKAKVELSSDLSYNPTPEITILSQLDMTLNLPKPEYSERLEELQGRLNQLSRQAQEAGVSTVIAFEGWDAAGKGGAIRRIIPGLDSRLSQVIPITAPSAEEFSYHYLWRFWRHIPMAGRVTIFDRSWYGRVLVERVEGYATEEEWMRAYAEINDFEAQLVSNRTVVCKFWMNITKEEQGDRFERRKKLPHKKWKLTEEDWRNREKWDAYEAAVNEMIERTSTFRARWTLVEANNKRFARIKVLETICDGLEKELAKSEA